MAEPRPTAVPKPCCVCDAPNGKHCAKCKSRHYCSKACQLVDWKEGGHNKACKQLAKEFQDRLLDELMPPKKSKEEPAIVADVLQADGAKAAARLSAVPTAKAAVAGAVNGGAPSWRGTCAICLDLLPIERDRQTFYSCCCKTLCTDCAFKCLQHNHRCPLCRARPGTFEETLCRLQEHADKGNAEARSRLGDFYREGGLGLKQNFKRAVQLYERAAAQGFAEAQIKLGHCYEHGNGVKINFKTAAQCYRRAAEQGHPGAQFNFGNMFYNGKGVAQSFDQAVKWYQLAVAQGHTLSLYYLGLCYAGAFGVPLDLREALRLFKLAAAKGHAGAAAQVERAYAPA